MSVCRHVDTAHTRTHKKAARIVFNIPGAYFDMICPIQPLSKPNNIGQHLNSASTHIDILPGNDRRTLFVVFEAVFDSSVISKKGRNKTGKIRTLPSIVLAQADSLNFFIWNMDWWIVIGPGLALENDQLWIHWRRLWRERSPTFDQSVLQNYETAVIFKPFIGQYHSSARLSPEILPFKS